MTRFPEGSEDEDSSRRSEATLAAPPSPTGEGLRGPYDRPTQIHRAAREASDRASTN